MLVTGGQNLAVVVRQGDLNDRIVLLGTKDNAHRWLLVLRTLVSVKPVDVPLKAEFPDHERLFERAARFGPIYVLIPHDRAQAKEPSDVAALASRQTSECSFNNLLSDSQHYFPLEGSRQRGAEAPEEGLPITMVLLELLLVIPSALIARTT